MSPLSEINHCLARIEAAYPAERLERARRIYDELWDFQTPFKRPPIVVHRGCYADGARHPAYHTRQERETTLADKLRHIAALSVLEDDYVPTLTLDTGAYIIGNAFGAKPVTHGGMYLIEPMIHDVAQARELPDFVPGTDHFYMEKVFSMLAFMRDATDGNVKINVHTPQGPLETLGTMWEHTDFYMALVTDVEVVQTALAKVLQAHKYYLRRQMEIIGSDLLQCNFAMSYVHRPPGTGIGVGDDIMATISPECFQVAMPGYRELAAEFGDLLVHSCGDPGHQLRTLCGEDCVRGIHLSQLGPADYFDRLERPLVVHSANDWASYEDVEAFVREAHARGLRYALQFQSLGTEMFGPDGDWATYDVDRIRRMVNRVREIVGKYYD